MLRSGRLQSMILWGPPGSGKTTVARLLADETKLAFEQLSAIFSGVQDLRKAFDRAKSRRETGKGTLLFIDEIHRFNRAQQDSFLPHMEDGTITLVGATTENPSFELNGALLSRAPGAGVPPARRGGARGAAARAPRRRRAAAAARRRGARDAEGHGRRRWPHGAQHGRGGVRPPSPPGAAPLDRAALTKLVQRRAPLYDKSRDGHYNLISALHKAVRGSDPDAALYWLARMLDGGEDRLFLARRLVRMAIEDIGLADPQAVVQALAAKDAFDFLGSPEGELALAQADDLSGHGAQIERRLRRLRRGHARGQGARQPGAAQAHPQRADQAHAGGGLRRRLRVRPRHRGGLLRPELFPRGIRRATAVSTIRRTAASSARSASVSPIGRGSGPSAAASRTGWSGAYSPAYTPRQPHGCGTRANEGRGMVQFVDLWRGHPINESVTTPCIAPHDLTNMEGEHILMGFPVFHNQCAIRLGVALRRAGVTDGQIGGCAACAVHPRSDMHFINASQLANALTHANIPGIGPVEKITGTEAAHYYPKLFGRTGIIYFQDYWKRMSDTGRATGDHIDVWNGYRSSAKWLLEWFSWVGYYSNYANAGEIWFWEVK